VSQPRGQGPPGGPQKSFPSWERGPGKKWSKPKKKGLSGGLGGGDLGVGGGNGDVKGDKGGAEGGGPVSKWD